MEDFTNQSGWQDSFFPLTKLLKDNNITPQKFKNTIPWLFHDQLCNFHGYLMHDLPHILAASLPH